MLTVVIVCTVFAFVAGVLDSIAGGGGLITLPSMLLMGIPPHMALGTGKFASTLGTSLALMNFARSNLVLWRIAGLGLIFSLLGAYAGAHVALLVDSALMGKIMVALLPVGMAVTLIPKKEQTAEPGALTPMQFWCFVPLVSFAVGAYDGFFGPGAGSFFILAFHWVLRMGLIEASATSKVFNLGSNLGALIGFLWNGKVLFALALPMAAANMAGNWVGSRMAIRIGPSIVRKFLTVSLGLLFVTLIWQYFFKG